MNQGELEALFNRINKSLKKNTKGNIIDNDMNKVRSYVVASQRPMQAVRLLQKEREERDAEEDFNRQKEDLYFRTQELERKKQEFKKRKQEMVEMVKAHIQDMLQNAVKKKDQENKRVTEIKETSSIEQKIIELNKELEIQEKKLKKGEVQRKSHRRYMEFLQRAIESTDEFKGDIDELMNRFHKLSAEQLKLKKEIQEFEKEIEETKHKQAQELRKVHEETVALNKAMHDMQDEVDGLAKENSSLKSEFENELEKKCSRSKEIGQISMAIKNLHYRCTQDQKIKGKWVETDDIDDLLKRLEAVAERIDDLQAVTEGNDYDREQAIRESVFPNRKERKPGDAYNLVSGDRREEKKEGII